MNLKTAILLGAIGSGLNLLLNLTSYIKFNVIERSEYITFESDFLAFGYLIGNLLIFVFLVGFYTNESKKVEKN